MIVALSSVLGHRDHKTVVTRVCVEADEASIVSHMNHTIAGTDRLQRTPHSLTALHNLCLWPIQ